MSQPIEIVNRPVRLVLQLERFDDSLFRLTIKSGSLRFVSYVPGVKLVEILKTGTLEAEAVFDFANAVRRIKDMKHQKGFVVIDTETLGLL